MMMKYARFTRLALGFLSGLVATVLAVAPAHATVYVKDYVDISSQTAGSVTYRHNWSYSTSSATGPWTSTSNLKGVLATQMPNLASAINAASWVVIDRTSEVSDILPLVSVFTDSDFSYTWVDLPYSWHSGTSTIGSGTVDLTIARISQTEGEQLPGSNDLKEYYQTVWSIEGVSTAPPTGTTARSSDLKGISVNVTSTYASSSASWYFAVYPNGTTLGGVSVVNGVPQGAMATATATGAKPQGVNIALPAGFENRGVDVEVLIVCNDNGMVTKTMVAGPPPPYLSGGSIDSSTGTSATLDETFTVNFTLPDMYNPNTGGMIDCWNSASVLWKVANGDGTTTYDGSTIISGWNLGAGPMSGSYTVSSQIGSYISFGFSVWNDIFGDYMSINGSGDWAPDVVNWSSLSVLVEDRDPSATISGPASDTVFSPGQTVSLSMTASANEDNDLDTATLQATINGGNYVDVETWDISGESWSATYDAPVPIGTTTIGWRVLVYDEDRAITGIVDTDYARWALEGTDVYQANTPPVASYSAEQNGGDVPIGEPIPITATGTDVDGNLDFVTLYYQPVVGALPSGERVPLETQNPATGQTEITFNYNHDVTEAPGEQFQFVIVADDGFATSTVSTPVFTPYYDNHAPTAEWVESDPVTVYVGDPVNLNATFGDADSNMTRADLEQGTTVISSTTDVAGVESITIPHEWTASAQGEYEFHWTVYDEGGLDGDTTTKTVSVRVAPEVSVGISTSPVTNNRSHRFNAGATDGDGDLSKIYRKYRIKPSGSSTWGNYINISTSSVSGSSVIVPYLTVALQTLEPGSLFEFSANAEDSLTRQSGWRSAVYTVENRAPTIAWQDTPTSVGIDEEVTLGVDASDLDGYIYRIRLYKSTGQLVATSYPTSSYSNTSASMQYNFSEGLPADYRYYWKVTDSSGATATTPLKTITVEKMDQTITFVPINDKVFGDPDFELVATASSGLPVTLTVVSGSATIDGNTVSITGLGNVTVKASQAGNSYYNAAPDVYRSFTVNKADQTIDFDPIPDMPLNSEDFSVNPTASSGLPVSISVSGAATLVDGKIHLTGLGTVSVTASQPGNEYYNPAPDVTRTFEVIASDNVITFEPIPDKIIFDPDFGLVASASSGLPVTFEVVSGADLITLTGSTVEILGLGDVTIRASQPGDATYSAATPVLRSFTINKADQTIDFGPIGDRSMDSEDFTVSATASSGLEVTFSISGPATLTDGLIHLTGQGTVTVTADQAGNEFYNPAPSVSQSFEVTGPDNVIDFEAIPDKVLYGPNFDLVATATSGLPVSFSLVSGPVSLSGSYSKTVTINGVGQATIRASQAGDENWPAAADVERTFMVNKAPQTITFPPIEDRLLGSASFSPNATASSGLPVSIATSNSAIVDYVDGLLVINGVGTVTITATQDGNEFYAAADPVARTFTVSDSGPVMGSIDLITPPFFNDKIHQFRSTWSDPDDDMDHIDVRYYYQAPEASNWTESGTLGSHSKSAASGTFIFSTVSVNGKMPNGLYRIEMRAVDLAGHASSWVAWEGEVVNRSPMVWSDQASSPETVKFADSVTLGIFARDLDKDLGQGYFRIITSLGGSQVLQDQGTLASNPTDPEPAYEQSTSLTFEARYAIGATVTVYAAFADSGTLTFTPVATYIVAETDPVVSTVTIESKAVPVPGMEIWFTDSETVSEEVKIAQDYDYPEQ